MMKFAEHPDHNRYISVSFDDNRRNLPMQMGIQVNYLMEDTGWDALRKAIRLDNEVMHLLKAAPALLTALTNLLKMVEDGDWTTVELEEARAAISAAARTTY